MQRLLAKQACCWPARGSDSLKVGGEGEVERRDRGLHSPPRRLSNRGRGVDRTEQLAAVPA